MRIVTVYSRSNCHLCEQAILLLEDLAKAQPELDFKVEEKLIDSDATLEAKYGQQVPVILIDGNPHDFFRVDRERFLKAIKKA